MMVGGIALIRKEIAERYPMPKGMGNIGFGEDGKEYKCPVTLEGGDKYCELQCDPLIAVQRDNDIICRSVAKPKKPGSVKENWAVGDWRVTISGIIVAETKDDLMLAIMALEDVCAVRESVDVTCPPLNEYYQITHLAIGQLQLPFTPGELNQQFTITAYSDTSHELLEEI